ncbi:MAG: leucyl/phenylalanyl-tRNA--protein transferase [Steroidobacteraceae bacterium]
MNSRRRRLPWLEPGADPDAFPPADEALDEPPGLLAAGGDLSVDRLLAAYRRGIFPWYSPGQPILWWCPDPREVLFPQQFHRSRSLTRRERRGDFEIRMDQAFAEVVGACAAPRARERGTWITPEMQAAYEQLHERGYAHSIEVWRDERLVGGVYGVRLGAVFFGESMFSREPDGSKLALSALATRSESLGLQLIDCQMPSPHLASLGSRTLPREEFLALLARWIPIDLRR